MHTPDQRFYAGEFRHFIDEKNRITIPARWRRGDAEEFIILAEATHQFLLVMSPEEFSRMSAAAESDPNVSARDRRIFFRQLHARAQPGAAALKFGICSVENALTKRRRLLISTSPTSLVCNQSEHERIVV